MLFLLGVGCKEKPIGQVERGCSKCAGQPFPRLWNRRAGLPSFSFPVIPFGASSGTRCNLCGMRYKATDELKSQVSGLAMAAKA